MINKINLLIENENNLTYANEIINLINKMELEITIVKDKSQIKEDELYLFLNNEGLALSKNNLILRLDYKDNLKRLFINNLNSEFVVKACKIKNEAKGLKLIDMTAGLGEDSLLLAASRF